MFPVFVFVLTVIYFTYKFRVYVYATVQAEKKTRTTTKSNSSISQTCTFWTSVSHKPQRRSSRCVLSLSQTLLYNGRVFNECVKIPMAALCCTEAVPIAQTWTRILIWIQIPDCYCTHFREGYPYLDRDPSPCPCPCPCLAV